MTGRHATAAPRNSRPRIGPRTRIETHYAQFSLSENVMVNLRRQGRAQLPDAV
jgi:hypothetical protein